ncbi:MAG: phosphate acyltransferase PlsX [Ruminococcaceae bacterium]|nr:phosphate acyltransferase PlsX [Oscillospiraceae bacterium]
MKIIVDCMSGDNAPEEIVRGALEGKQKENVELLLVGNEAAIREVASKYNFSLDGCTIVENTGENITMEDDATSVVKEKNESSMAVALKLLKDGQGDGMVSAGNTGALLTGATLILRRIKGVRRPALGAVLPFGTPTLLADAGAQAVCAPEDLVMFARMGSMYMNKVMGVENPKVALINNGAEECKGTDLQKETYQALKNIPEINFAGNIEGREIFDGEYDVLIADGFTGNIVLKTCEGAGKFVKKCLSDVFYRNFSSKIAYLFAKGSVNQLRKDTSYDSHGGAPFLGIAKPVIKGHGSSNHISIAACVGQAKRYAESGMIEYIASLKTSSTEEKDA